MNPGTDISHSPWTKQVHDTEIDTWRIPRQWDNKNLRSFQFLLQQFKNFITPIIPMHWVWKATLSSSQCKLGAGPPNPIV